MKKDNFTGELTLFIDEHKNDCSLILATKLIDFLEKFGISFCDELTGLHHRKSFYRYFEELTNQCDRIGGVLSLGFIDLDNFKQINDTHGHAVGDKILKKVGETLRQQTRSYDKAFRWGGEEFVVISLNKSPNKAADFYERLHRKMRFKYDSIKVTASMGVVSYSKGDKAEELITAADRGMYIAKEKKDSLVFTTIMDFSHEGYGHGVIRHVHSSNESNGNKKTRPASRKNK